MRSLSVLNQIKFATFYNSFGVSELSVQTKCCLLQMYGNKFFVEWMNRQFVCYKVINCILTTIWLRRVMKVNAILPPQWNFIEPNHFIHIACCFFSIFLLIFFRRSLYNNYLFVVALDIIFVSFDIVRDIGIYMQTAFLFVLYSSLTFYCHNFYLMQFFLTHFIYNIPTKYTITKLNVWEYSHLDTNRSMFRWYYRKFFQLIKFIGNCGCNQVWYVNDKFCLKTLSFGNVNGKLGREWKQTSTKNFETKWIKINIRNRIRNRMKMIIKLKKNYNLLLLVIFDSLYGFHWSDNSLKSAVI